MSAEDYPDHIEPEVGTPHAEAHNAAGLEPHDHLHGHGEGQHTHEGWVPDRVQARLKRDGFCGAADRGGFCMGRTPCPRHPEESA